MPPWKVGYPLRFDMKVEANEYRLPQDWDFACHYRCYESQSHYEDSLSIHRGPNYLHLIRHIERWRSTR